VEQPTRKAVKPKEIAGRIGQSSLIFVLRLPAAKAAGLDRPPQKGISEILAYLKRFFDYVLAIRQLACGQSEQTDFGRRVGTKRDARLAQLVSFSLGGAIPAKATGLATLSS
jgi:hypothetical protein